MNYTELKEYIEVNYPGLEITLIKYMNSDSFINDVEATYQGQIAAGEYLGKQMVAECVIDKEADYITNGHYER